MNNIINRVELIEACKNVERTGGRVKKLLGDGFELQSIFPSFPENMNNDQWISHEIILTKKEDENIKIIKWSVEAHYINKLFTGEIRGLNLNEPES